MAFRTMAERLSQADTRRDRLDHAVDVLLLGACQQPCDQRAPGQGPVDQSAAPPPPGRPGHSPRGTAPGAGPRIVLRLPRDPHATIVAARWCLGQALPWHAHTAGHGGRPPAGDVRPVADDGGMIGDRWGVSDSEVRRAYPCDDFVASPVLQAWRGIRIQAPAGAVWPW